MRGFNLKSLTVEAADQVFTVANIALVISLVVGVIATGLIVWMGNVKESDLKTELSDANRAISEANRAAEADRLARVKLEQRIQPRNLNAEQVHYLLARLRPMSRADQIALPLTVAVFATNDTLEAHRFADQIAGVFKEAGFTINRNTVHYGNPYAVVGLGILTSTDGEAVERGNKILSAFHEVGIAASQVPPRTTSDGKDENTRAFNLGVSVMVGDRIF